MKSPAKLTFETILVVTATVALATAPLTARAGNAPAAPATFEAFDSDDSGTLSEEEFEAGRAARHATMAAKGGCMKGMAEAPSFADFDSDGDAVLSRDEFNAGHQKHMAEMQSGCHGQKHGKRMHKGAAHERGMHHPMMFEEIDSNGDGCIDRAELDAHHGVATAD